MLTDEQIKDEASHHGFIGSTEMLVKFARAIESEVRASHMQAPAGAKPSDAQVWAAREAWNQQTNEHEAMRAALIAAALTQPTHAQSVPLTDEWIRSRCKESWIFDTAKQWVRMTEAAHGITKEGSQHAD